MRMTPYSYNGFLFQQQNKVSADFQNPFDWDISGISTSDIPRSLNFPLRVAKSYAGRLKVINVSLLDVDMTRDSLVIAMDVLGEEQGQLIVTDELGRAWYVNADFIGLTEDGTDKKTASFGAVFAVDDPVWKKRVLSTKSTDIGLYGSGSLTITPIGNQPALPIITITPQSPGVSTAGFTYQRFIAIINNSPNALDNYPLDITGGGLDTATLITDGKMLSDGQDLRIYVDGVEVKRWFGGGGIDDANTLIFINFSQPANTDMTLGENIAGSGDITYIQIQNTALNVARFATIPVSGKVKIGSEIFVYTGINPGALQLTGITRAERQSSAGAHTTGDAIYFVTHDVWMYYGYPYIAPYVEDDTYKPIIDLALSTNTSHIYNGLFYTLDGKRTAQWKKTTFMPAINSRHYTATENTLADPATVIGMWNEKASILAWTLYNPCEMITIMPYTGKKYAENAAFYAFMAWSYDGISYLSLAAGDEPDPAPGGGWVPLATHPEIDLPPVGVDPFYRPYYIQFWNYGFTGPSGSNRNGFEVDYFEAELNPDRVPTIALASEADNFHLGTTFANAATGFALEVIMSLPLGSSVVIDTKRKKVTLYDGSNQINAIQDFPVRKDWFPLLAGLANVITITDAGNVLYKFEWEDRYL